ncbi:MAG TPA: bifunctional cobalt-precorrin-7 (C(5))-methyltransferase/cobalt-precorrin-6B (C(15))-methyltransferase [Thauera aminoaromatica]|jgi:precorrin-6Y C5,15-methyltransferase (decarboxylating)|uniref:Precorrin-6y C5,15-methyltransferase subunit CbiE n=1 Tax=Thauera aminoaromatica S2 TaxID=1234381 RepID=N6YU38_THASP|nr:MULTISPECIES: bifunctional cobalt-precorrin-7 (C(5))-methyltransferase/cobalt-precorrin-6B (C(15))-methyltransferase [Thauera]MDA0233327.1 bifunctional cobalt-precorrin-7 (C(5))-methyltransferase/cobalt-precorrin-6B (C(15))-methyltransferase [Pseudomonadota bacterium]ENO85688.1 precorrin-6y C5,15-methyltransferase subunit CbiE [Thauera aminoaromatica S2]KIN89692.1 precorrin-6Y C5,15-methyltransferase (decarboxylating), CbiT subunit [Thauera sp. SWB20]MBP6132832.1 bifunctional cobalt-precorri
MPESTAPVCSIVGLLDDGWDGLGAAARRRIEAAASLIGAGRTLERIAPHAPSARLLNMDGALTRVPGWIEEAVLEGDAAVVLATGDPLCHGIAGFLIDKLGAARLEVLPATSTLQLAFARLKRSWQEARFVSCHGADADEWQADPRQPGPTPEHGLYRVVRAVAEHPLVACFTSPANSPDRIARALLAAGHGAPGCDEDLRLSVVARLCLDDEAVFAGLSLQEAASRRFPEPNVVVIERTCVGTALFGVDDLDYVQRTPEKGLITKLEARAVALAKLALRADSRVWDIGAGSGSVGLEASRIARHGHVWAIEKNPADAANARTNARRLRASNYSLFEGKAPAGLDAWPDPDAVFIGGSGGELGELITLVLRRLVPGGRLVMNFVTLENLATATSVLAAADTAWEVTMLSAARSQPILDMHRLAAQNPVWIVTTRKEAP